MLPWPMASPRSSRPPAGILFENAHLLVLDKPAGLLTIPDPQGGADLSGLMDEWIRARDLASPPPWAEGKQEPVHIHPCHRLDRDTSGLILYARGKRNQKTIMELFAARETTKIYLALVNGQVGTDSGSMRQPIDGKDALTQFQVLARTSDFSVLKCKIHTGRTNQIRIHCAAMGHPLVGDDKFGRRRDFAFPAKRTMLHAWYAAFPWPWSNLPLPPGGQNGEARFTAPLPGDMQDPLLASGLEALVQGGFS